jgi:hypothetical protein
MDFKYVGILDEKIALKCGIYEHRNKPILVYKDRIDHVIDHHLKDFGSIDNIMKSYNNIHNIIKKPDYYFYNKKNNSLEYYKTFGNNLCVAVRINPGKVLKVRSWFPPNKNKIENRKKKGEQKEGL